MTSTTEVEAAILKLYKRLQNGSDVRGIAVEGMQLFARETTGYINAYAVHIQGALRSFVAQELRGKSATSPQQLHSFLELVWLSSLPNVSTSLPPRSEFR